MAIDKVKRANKKWKYEQRRKQKTRKEKMLLLGAAQRKSRRRKNDLAYVQGLRDELGYE